MTYYAIDTLVCVRAETMSGATRRYTRTVECSHNIRLVDRYYSRMVSSTHTLTRAPERAAHIMYYIEISRALQSSGGSAASQTARVRRRRRRCRSELLETITGVSARITICARREHALTATDDDCEGNRDDS